MPIVLAVEPDPRQAAHLTAIVGHQAGAELILADTTEGALDAIGDRVPDLVLVPALLSPRDDAALAAALRVIAVAAHVRTLTIPVLASATPRAAPAGILARWRRSRAASPAPDGCDPSVFGEQISTYLREAAVVRAEIDEELNVAPLAAVGPVPLHEPSVAPAAAVPPSPEPIETVASEPIDVVAEPIGPPALPVEPWAAGPIEESLIDLSDELAAMSDEEVDDGLVDGEPAGLYTISAETDAAEIETFNLAPAILEPQAIALSARADEVQLEVFDLLPAILEPPVIGPDASSEIEATPLERFGESPEPPPTAVEPWVPLSPTAGRRWPAIEGMPVETPAARTEHPDWIELVASLRQDLEHRRVEPAQARVHPIAARPSDSGATDAGPTAKKHQRHAKKLKPIQDEWGFFDPEQCGFSTLLAKLEEITEEEVRT